MIWDNINIVRKRPVLKECLAFEQSPVAPLCGGEGILALVRRTGSRCPLEHEDRSQAVGSEDLKNT